jgi:uncharacterized protein
MIIDLNKIPEEGITLSGEEPATILGLEEDRFLHTASPLAYTLTVQLASHQVIVSGSLKARLKVQCVRCAEFFSTTLQDSSFLRAYEIQTGMDTLDVTDDLREGILLLVPHFPLCSPDCKGLCPQCGANKNHGPCACAQEKDQAPWDNLNRIKF